MRILNCYSSTIIIEIINQTYYCSIISNRLLKSKIKIDFVQILNKNLSCQNKKKKKKTSAKQMDK